MKTTICRTASAVLFFVVSIVGVAAQPARKELTPNPLIKIIRYEDQRNWNDDLKGLLSAADPNVRKRAALASGRIGDARAIPTLADIDRKSTRLNSSHSQISYAVFCLKKKK